MNVAEHVFNRRFWYFALIYWAGFGLYFVDRQPTGVWLFTQLAPSWVGDAEKERLGVQLVFGSGAALVVLAAMLRTWATAYLHTSVVHDNKLHSNQIVASGPYRFVRNPLYLGGKILTLGFALFASRSGAVVMIVGVTALHLSLIHTEEGRLMATIPESFIEYKSKVPQLFPTPWPRIPPSRAKPQWLQSFVGEAMFWIFAVGAVAFAVTLDGRWMPAVGIGGFLFYTLVIPRIRRRFLPAP